MLLLGVLAWLAQPLYVVAELVAAAGSRVPYSLIDQTISDLGVTTCTSIDYPYGPVEVCSPWHALVNGALVVVGALLAVGAVLLRRFLPRRRSTTVSTVLWVVAGASSIATGFVPLDHGVGLHALVALPALLAQPVALVLLAAALRPAAPRLAGGTAVAGVASVVGLVAFLVFATRPELGGVWERLAFWPTYLWLPVVAAILLRQLARPHG